MYSLLLLRGASGTSPPYDRCYSVSTEIRGDCIPMIMEQKYGNTDAYCKTLQELDFRLRNMM